MSNYSKTIGCLSLVLFLFFGSFTSVALAESRVVVGDFSAFESPAPTPDEEEQGWVDTASNRVYTGDFSACENMKPSLSSNKSAAFVESTPRQFLLTINQPDPNYQGTSVAITPVDRALLEKIVMGECNSSLTGATLVAQCLRDGMVYGGYQNVSQVQFAYRYHVSNRQPNQYAVEAVQNVFDKGQSAVQHRILYFYAPRLVNSSFHESQYFVVEYGGHRYFDRR